MCPAQPPSKPTVREGTTLTGKSIAGPRATGPGEARHTKAGPRGRPARQAAGHNYRTEPGARQPRPPGAANPESTHNTKQRATPTQERGHTPTHHPCRLGGPHGFRAGGRIRSGPQVGKVATSPLPPRGSPPLQSGGQNQKWPTSGQGGYITRAAWRVPTASERGDRIRIGPQVGKVATSPLPPRGSPPLQSGGTESEVAHNWARWLHHPCRLGGSPPLQSGGTESELAHKWARWLHHPCRLGVPTASERGDRNRSGPQVGKMATLPLPLGGPHGFRAGRQNQKWPTSGQGGYITPAASGVPTASERGAESEVAHKWARWLHHPCRLGGPHRFRAAGRIRSGPQVGKVATSPLPPRGVPTTSERGDRIRIGPQVGKMATLPLPLGGPHRFRAGGQNQKWPTSGQDGYITPAAWGSPRLPSGGTESEVAHKWARWLHHPCRLGGPHGFRAGGRIRSGPQVGKVATSPLPPRGSPGLQSGGQNQKWPTSGQGGYITSAAWGVPTASERGDRIRIGPQVGKVATSPLPPRGSPPLQSGGTE